MQIRTIGIDFKIVRVWFRRASYKLQVWDTAGQERFRTITRSYFRGADGVLLVFNTNNRATMESTARWHEQIKADAKEGLGVVLVGIRGRADDDGAAVAAAVSDDEARQHAERLGLPLVTCDCRSGEGVDEAVSALLRRVAPKTDAEAAARPNRLPNTRDRQAAAARRSLWSRMVPSFCAQ